MEKLTLRITGCLIGSALGLLVLLRLVPWATDIGGLMILVFAGALLGAWIAAGDKRISYAGFQIAFAYFLCVIQGPSPSFNMVTARDRVIGILVGNIVSYFVATRIWPVSVEPRIVSSLNRISANMKSIGDAQDVWSRRRLAAETSSMLEQITSDIHLARYEPEWIRPRRTELIAQQAAADAAQMLEPPLLGISELAPEWAGDVLRNAFTSTATSSESGSDAGSTHATGFPSLEALLCRRIALFQQALSNLTKVEQDA